MATPRKRWIDTGGFGVNGTIDFSHDLGSFYYQCAWGCFATDFESTWEAEQAFTAHDCNRSS